MAKATKRRPAPEKPVKTRKCVFCSKKGQGRHRLQGHRAAAHLHQRARQDPRPPGDRQLRAAPARHRDRGQERPRGRAAAVQLVDALTRRTEGKIRDETDSHRRGGPPRCRPATPSRSRTATAATTCCPADWRSSPPGAPSARPTTIRRAREIKTVRGLEHANELKTALEGLGAVDAAGEDRRPTPASCSARSPPPTSSARSRRPADPNLDKRTVQLPKAHIKTLGTHPVAVRLHPDVDAAVSVNVVAE